MKKNLIIFFVAIIFIASASWYYCNEVIVTKIGDIITSPQDYNNKDVVVQGEVTEKMSLFKYGYYKLKDETGEIFIVSDNVLPTIGTDYRVAGEVKEAFALGELQVLVIVENR